MANKHESIYEHLSSITGLKFKAHLKGTDIQFKDLYKMHNLTSGIEDYLVLIEGSKSFRFTNLDGFIDEMIFLVKDLIGELNNEFRELNRRQENDAIVDEVAMFERHEYIGYTGERLLKLLNVLREKRKNQ